MKRTIILQFLLIFIVGVTLSSCVDTLPDARPALKGDVIDPNDPVIDPDPVDPDTNTITRPDGLITFKADHCSCLDKKPTMLGICDSFCASKDTNAEYLYANFNMNVLELDDNFSSLTKWCNSTIKNEEGESESLGAACSLEIKSEGNPTTMIALNSGSDFFGNNSVRVGVGGQFVDGVNYVLTLVETGSQSMARTSSVNYQRLQDPPDENNLGPLKILPVNQYTCMTRGFGNDEVGNFFYETAYRLHFYFTGAEDPPAIPPGVRTIFCHDIYASNQTLDDKIQYPRMELQPGHFNTWNYNDPRFGTDAVTGNMKIHDKIKKIVEQNGATFANGQKIFYPFSWPSYPKDALPAELQSDTMPANSLLGYIMTPWIDANTFKVYCPNQTHYYSTNQLFIALRELVGVDTEGIYLAVRETLTTTDGSGTTILATDDYLIIREGLLKKVWFYFQNGQHIRADENSAATKTVHFYWPPDPDNPFMKKSNQKLYTVRHPSAFTNSAATGAGIPSVSGQTVGDKKFGCVPATQDNIFTGSFVD